jgi:formamidopyrimidine-DNA glycosylase
MSGRITWSSHTLPSQKHDHVLFKFNHGFLIYNDPRRFGYIDLIPLHNLANYPYLKHKGLEPLEAEFTPENVKKIFTSRSQAIKQTLMNHHLIVGVGNIYACESLWRACIAPHRPSHSLTQEECTKLVQEVQNTLNEAIAAGGSTLKDFKNAGGDIGYFQNQHKVYGREGSFCERCQSNIHRVSQGGRSTFFCPQCQI